MIGVVAMAYGSPATPSDIEAYYTHIRRGRAPSPEQLADLRRRYDAIGGVSPLAARTQAQCSQLQRALDQLDPGTNLTVALGHKHAAPFIEDAVATLAAAGAVRVVGLVLAPHYSRGSVGEYIERLAVAARRAGIECTAIESWHDEPAWLDFQAKAVIDALDGLPGRGKVLFTAHSLPERMLDGDRYPQQLAQSAAAIAARAGIEPWSGWGLAWQSAGRTPEPWRGPDVLDVLADLAATGAADSVLVCPQGFTSDHLEVSFDLDVEAAGRAEELGLAFRRTVMPNDDPAIFAALARRVAALV